MKRLVCLMNILLAMFLSFGCAPSNVDTVPSDGEVLLSFQGEGHDRLLTEERVVVLSRVDGLFGHKQMATCFDRQGKKLWSARLNTLSIKEACMLDDGSLVYLDEKGRIAALDADGREKWETAPPEHSRFQHILAAKEGGVAAFGIYDDPAVLGKRLTAFLITDSGTIGQQKPLAAVRSMELRHTAAGASGYILCGRGQRHNDALAADLPETAFIVHLHPDFSVDWVYYIANNESVANLVMGDDTLLFTGTCKRASVLEKEKMFIRELDAEGQESHTLYFEEGELPFDIAYMPDGSWAAAFYSQDDPDAGNVIRRYNADWTEIHCFLFDDQIQRLTPTSDNGLMIEGYKLAPREEWPTDGWITDRSTNAVLDTVVERLDDSFESRWKRVYKGTKGKSGYEFFAFADSHGDVYIED